MNYKKGKENNFLKANLMHLKYCILPIVFCLLLAFPSCKEKKKTETAIVKKDVYYTCSMHTQVHEDHPGNCPICGMKWIAVAQRSQAVGNTMNTQIYLSAEQIRQVNSKADKM